MVLGLQDWNTALLDQEAFGPCIVSVTEPTLDFGESTARGGPWAGKFALLFVFAIEPSTQQGPR